MPDTTYSVRDQRTQLQSEPWVELIEGDCLDVMPTLEAGSVDLILTDLPYGTTQNAWDAVIPFEPLWREFWRLCPLGAVVLTAAQPFSSALVMSQPQFFKHEWIWEKNNPSGHLNAKKMPMRAHEQVLVFARGACPYHPQMTKGTPKKTTRRTFSPSYGAQKETSYDTDERYPRTVQFFNGHPKSDAVHPTQKPLALIEYLIATYSLPGQTVLAATAGSGTVAVAARSMGRNSVSIERDPKYYDIASERLWPAEEASK